MPQQAAARADDEDRYLRRGVFVDGRVWLLTDRDTLFSIDERTRRRSIADLPDDVLDICRHDGQLFAVTGERDARSWAVRRRNRGGTWAIVARARSGALERLLAMDCTAGVPVTLLTTGQLIELRPEGAASVTLSELTYARVGMTTLGTSAYLYVGLNSGEWGGGLRRIERATGRTVKVENETGPCRGLLNTNCDPVHAIITIPWRPNCLAVAVGLVHFMAHGRIVEVCGERVTSLYSRDEDDDAGGDAEDGQVVGGGEAFFGMVPTGSTLLAAGTDGLYRIGPAGLIDSAPYPSFHAVRGVYLNFDRPDAILAVTEINRRASVSGSSPLLIPR
jgi:hypothetical protein